MARGRIQTATDAVGSATLTQQWTRYRSGRVSAVVRAVVRAVVKAVLRVEAHGAVVERLT